MTHFASKDGLVHLLFAYGQGGHSVITMCSATPWFYDHEPDPRFVYKTREPLTCLYCVIGKVTA